MSNIPSPNSSSVNSRSSIRSITGDINSNSSPRKIRVNCGPVTAVLETPALDLSPSSYSNHNNHMLFANAEDFVDNFVGFSSSINTNNSQNNNSATTTTLTLYDNTAPAPRSLQLGVPPKQIFSCAEHQKSCRGLNFSPDGRILVSAADPGMMLIRDPSTGRVIQKLQVKSSGSASRWPIAFSRCSKRFATANSNWQIDIYAQMKPDVPASWKHIASLPDGFHTDSIEDIDFDLTQYTRLVSASTDRRAIVWSLESLECKFVMQHERMLYAASYSTDGRMIATGDLWGFISIWDAHNFCRETGNGIRLREIPHAHDGPVKNIGWFQGCEQRIISVSSDATIRIFDASMMMHSSHSHSKNNNESSSNENANIVTSTTTSTTENEKQVQGDQQQQQVQQQQQQQQQDPLLLLIDVGIACTSGHLSPDQHIIAVSCMDNTVRMFSTVSGLEISEPMVGHKEQITNCRFHPSGTSLASCSLDRSVKLWHLPINLQEKRGPGRPIGETINLVIAPAAVSSSSASHSHSSSSSAHENTSATTFLQESQNPNNTINTDVHSHLSHHHLAFINKRMSASVPASLRFEDDGNTLSVYDSKNKIITKISLHLPYVVAHQISEISNRQFIDRLAFEKAERSEREDDIIDAEEIARKGIHWQFSTEKREVEEVTVLSEERGDVEISEAAGRNLVQVQYNSAFRHIEDREDSEMTNMIEKAANAEEEKRLEKEEHEQREEIKQQNNKVVEEILKQEEKEEGEQVIIHEREEEQQKQQQEQEQKVKDENIVIASRSEEDVAAVVASEEKTTKEEEEVVESEEINKKEPSPEVVAVIEQEQEQEEKLDVVENKSQPQKPRDEDEETEKYETPTFQAPQDDASSSMLKNNFKNSSNNNNNNKSGDDDENSPTQEEKAEEQQQEEKETSPSPAFDPLSSDLQNVDKTESEEQQQQQEEEEKKNENVVVKNKNDEHDENDDNESESKRRESSKSQSVERNNLKMDFASIVTADDDGDTEEVVNQGAAAEIGALARERERSPSSSFRLREEERLKKQEEEEEKEENIVGLQQKEEEVISEEVISETLENHKEEKQEQHHHHHHRPPPPIRQIPGITVVEEEEEEESSGKQETLEKKEEEVLPVAQLEDDASES